MISTATPNVTAGFAGILRGEPVRWEDLGLTRAEFFALCDREELHGLLFSRIAASAANHWPADVREQLSQRARDDMAREMLRREETAAILGALTAGGVRPLVMKGTALAYTAYDTPVARPRFDIDLLIDSGDQAAARRMLEDRGYAAPPYCDTLFSQCQMERIDEFGFGHVIDLHWKISTQPVFADVLTYDEMWSRAVRVPALGPAAVVPCTVDALLLACIHPVMHHHNAERMLWIYDTHLLISSLTRNDLHEFAERAMRKNVAAVCAHELRRAQALFGTRLPADDLRMLSAAVDEPSAAYLATDRTWRHELASSVRALPRAGDRIKLLRDVLLPSPSYMLGTYGLRGKTLGPWLLPALYVHRNMRGAWRVLRGKK